MQTLIENFSSPYWWATAVVLSIALNLFSNLLWRVLERTWADMSAVRSERLAKKQEARAARIAKLKASDRALFLAVRKEHGWWLWTAMLFAVAALSMVAGNIDYTVFPTAAIILKFILSVLSIIAMLLGINSLRKGAVAASEIDEALRDPAS
jgi:hypothetical protein